MSKVKRGKPKKESSKLVKEESLKTAYEKLLKRAEAILQRSAESVEILEKERQVGSTFEELMHFTNYAKMVIDQIERRVFKGEVISHEEKIFSVFEPHTEWISKGKAKAPVELGKRVSVVEDDYGFLLHHKVMNKQTDDKIAIEIIQETKRLFPSLSSCSFDKGFYSKENREELSKIVDFVALPKKGKLSKLDQEVESSDWFIKSRKKHPAIESAINALEVHGLDRCLDHGIKGFERYVAIAVVSRNVQKLGALVKKQKRKQEQRVQRFCTGFAA